jgi:hypothetical protein
MESAHKIDEAAFDLHRVYEWQCLEASCGKRHLALPAQPQLQRRSSCPSCGGVIKAIAVMGSGRRESEVFFTICYALWRALAKGPSDDTVLAGAIVDRIDSCNISYNTERADLLARITDIIRSAPELRPVDQSRYAAKPLTERILGALDGVVWGRVPAAHRTPAPRNS